MTRLAMRDARRSAGAHPRKAGNNAVAALSWLPLIMEITNGVEGLGRSALLRRLARRSALLRHRA